MDTNRAGADGIRLCRRPLRIVFAGAADGAAQWNGAANGWGNRVCAQAYGTSFWLGTALIAVGVIVNLVSARNHVRLVQELNRGGTGYARPSSLAIAVAVTLAVMGLAMAIYLVAVREPRPVRTGSREEKEMNDLRKRDRNDTEPSLRGRDDCEAGSDARGQGSEGVCPDRPQRRGGKGRACRCVPPSC